MVFYVIGIVLLIIEVFLPTFGIVGILGILSVAWGIGSTADSLESALVSAVIAIVIVGIAVTIAAVVLKRRGFWNRFILRERLTTEQGYVSQPDRHDLIGKSGVALTPLRPAGAADLDGERVDVVTDGEFIPSGSTIVVLRVEGSRVIVKPNH